jgi:hypothetical protein
MRSISLFSGITFDERNLRQPRALGRRLQNDIGASTCCNVEPYPYPPNAKGTPST